MIHRASQTVALLGVVALCGARSSNSPRTDWIDPDTGHRVIRVSSEAGSQTLYFHDNAYSPEGDRCVCSSPSGIMMVKLATLGAETPTPELIVPNGVGAYMAR